jgi:hypothetical protein
MQDLINKVKAYNELQEQTIQFIDKLANHAMDISEDAYEDLIELKDMVYSDEILLQDAIKKASSIFDSMDLVK